MDYDNMNPSKFREIVRNGRITAFELADSFCAGRYVSSESSNSSTVPIDTRKVPVLVNPKQFEAMQLRRQVRAAMERTRISAGRSKDNRRTGVYKSLQKHLHATRRPRAQGTFVSTRIKEEPASLCN